MRANLMVDYIKSRSIVEQFIILEFISNFSEFNSVISEYRQQVQPRATICEECGKPIGETAWCLTCRKYEGQVV